MTIYSQQYQEILDSIPYSKYLGLCVTQNSHTQGPVFHLPFKEKLIGNWTLPAIHGGVIGGMMEISALVYVNMTEGQSKLPKIVDFSVDYLRTAKPQECMSRCELVRQGKRVVAVKISCWQSDPDKPIAVSRAHLLLEQQQDTHSSTRDSKI